MSRLNIGMGTDELPARLVMYLAVGTLALEVLSDNCQRHPPVERTMSLELCRQVCDPEPILAMDNHGCTCLFLTEEP